ncbi:MAG: 50S ribosomal protein L22 [Desulfomonile sp.]|jgi:large subunit ribosomal protein L22|nr:50S ribosomal protein L22 [Deltaproteobacteria bacterium]
MEWESTLRHAHISPRKARLVADLVRGMSIGPAIGLLDFTPKKAAGIIKKVLHSALHNAKQSSGVDEDKLIVSRITVDEGPTAKRWSPRAMGRATRIRKRTSHICVALEEK